MACNSSITGPSPLLAHMMIKRFTSILPTKYIHHLQNVKTNEYQAIAVKERGYRFLTKVTLGLVMA